MAADVLSDVLRAIRLTGAVYFDFELSSPWVAEAPPSREIAAVVMPGAERVIEYHLIARGACWGQVVGQEPIRLNEGSARAGTENILARLSELMFVEALRRYLASAPLNRDRMAGGSARSGRWPGAGRAACRAGRRVDRRAARAGGRVSRSILAERFAEMVGQPPMQDLALWRMQLVSRLLADGGHVTDVAAAVGYESEAAFSRAFKKLVGQAPGAWRRDTVPPKFQPS